MLTLKPYTFAITHGFLNLIIGVRELTFRTSQRCNQQLQKSMFLPTHTS
jgi:hypothetical protein